MKPFVFLKDHTNLLQIAFIEHDAEDELRVVFSARSDNVRLAIDVVGEEAKLLLTTLRNFQMAG